jgi:nitrogen-specific signal transduction histidine kinase
VLAIDPKALSPFGKRSGRVLIQVRDTGWAKSRLADMIFEPFVTTQSRGCGLALSTSRSLVEAHEGC